MTWRQVDGAYMSVGLGDLIAGAYTPIGLGRFIHMGTGGQNKTQQTDIFFLSFIF